MKIKISILFIISFIIPFAASGQIRGLPKIANFKQEDYAAGAQNWDIVQSQDGRLYFGNYLGLLEFDGVNWSLKLTLKNKSTVWGLAIDDQDNFFIGGNHDFGYARKNELNQIEYISLQDSIPKEKQYHTIVWDIIINENKVIYQANESLILLENNSLKVIKAPSLISYCTKIDNKIFVVDRDSGLYQLKNDQLEKIKTNINWSTYDICFILPYGKEKYLIGTKRNGVFIYSKGDLTLWNQWINQKFTSNYVLSCASMVLKNLYVIGTEENGFFLTNKNGRILQHITVEKGLENNSVTDLFSDKHGNLWVSLFSGISYVEYNSPFSYIGTESKLPKASSYASILHNNYFYVGTNQGLFVTKWPEKDPESSGSFEDFQKISSGHVWGLQRINKQLFMTSHNGLFIVKGQKLKQVPGNMRGAWTIVKIPGKLNKYILGTYEGLFILSQTYDKWAVNYKLKGFNESAREIMFQNGYLWVGHGLKGVYQLELNDVLDSLSIRNFYDESNQLPSSLFNSIFNIDGEIYLGTQQGIYCFNNEKDQFYKEKNFNKVIGDGTIVRRFYKINNSQYFFIKDYENNETIGIISSYPDNSQTIKSDIFNLVKGKFVSAFEHINFISSKDIFLTSKHGLIHYNDKFELKDNMDFSANISKIICTKNDSLLYGGNDLFYKNKIENEIYTLKYEENAIKISYTSAFYINPNATVYQSWLKGYEEDWSNWNTNKEREFTNLREGTYTFYVRAKNVFGKISREGAYTFKVLPPWHRSHIVYVVYGLLFIALMYFLFKYISKRLMLERKKIEAEKNSEINKYKQSVQQKELEIEAEIIKLQNDRLKSEIEHKSAELNSSTMHLLQISQTVNTVKEKIERLYPHCSSHVREKLKDLIEEVDESYNKDEVWENFELLFEQLHDNFIKRITEKYPDLTSRDTRLIAYLRLNLTTKEIAPLMGITIRAIDSMRYRVRKKLGLNSSEDLTEFIIKF